MSCSAHPNRRSLALCQKETMLASGSCAGTGTMSRSACSSSNRYIPMSRALLRPRARAAAGLRAAALSGSTSQSSSDERTTKSVREGGASGRSKEQSSSSCEANAAMFHQWSWSRGAWPGVFHIKTRGPSSGFSLFEGRLHSSQEQPRRERLSWSRGRNDSSYERGVGCGPV